MKSKGEEAIEQDRLHLVSATAAAQAETETDHPQAGDAPPLPVALLGLKIVQQKDDNQEDHFRPENPDLIIPAQRATVVYANKYNSIVIRQEADWNDDGDSFVFVQPQHVDALVEKLMEYKAFCEDENERARGTK